MSSKSSRKPQKGFSLKTQDPRAMPEIEKEYSELLSKAAQAQYLVFVHTNALQELNERLLEVNQEAAQRQSADRVKETTNEQA